MNPIRCQCQLWVRRITGAVFKTRGAMDIDRLRFFAGNEYACQQWSSDRCPVAHGCGDR